MTPLSICEITFSALRREVRSIQSETHSCCRLGEREISALIGILFEDAHRNSSALWAYATVHDFVNAQMKKWGYLVLKGTSFISFV